MFTDRLFFACCFQALEDAFLAIDSRMTTEEVIKELVQIAGRPTEEPPSEKVAEEDDCEYTPNIKMHVVKFGIKVGCKERTTKLILFMCKIGMQNCEFVIQHNAIN